MQNINQRSNDNYYNDDNNIKSIWLLARTKPTGQDKNVGKIENNCGIYGHYFNPCSNAFEHIVVFVAVRMLFPFTIAIQPTDGCSGPVFNLFPS